MSRRSPVVVKRVHREIAYFNIIWSPLLPVSRWDINGAVPSMAGIWELYYLENARVPRILKMGRAWYGGLRNEIRTESDPDLPQNAAHRRVLESGDCYYRYTLCEQGQDLTDVYSVLLSHRNVGQPPVTASGRYSDVRIQEPDEMEIHRTRRPHEERTPPPMMGSRVPNMFDVAAEWKKYDAEQHQAAEERESDQQQAGRQAPQADPDSGE
ncbi:MAG: hypothetical protein WD492_16275 [Alkalispirochaeta sp.]